RMGHKPKSLLQLDGQPLIKRMANHLLQAGVSQLVVVLGHYADDIGAALVGLPVDCVLNPDPGQGLVSSQRLGLHAISADTGLVVMALADQPLVTAEDIRTLMHVFVNRPGGTELVFPAVQGQPGNPVLLSDTARAEILSGGSDWGCKEWRQTHPSRCHRHVNDNLHFVTDLDLPQDIDDFERKHGMRLHWPNHW
ncbi:MAG: NTP transferase domain-containing protein, partial [Limnohabitans sp.]